MIDQLKLFRGESYKINDKITIRHPTLEEIVNFGEQRYFGLVRTICSTPADRKVEIWDKLHIFWEQMDEYDLFISLFQTLKLSDVSILFGDMDFESFKLVTRSDPPELVLMNKDHVIVDRAIHKLMTDYLRQIHKLKKNVDTGYNDATRMIMIEDDRDEMMLQMRKPFRSLLMPLVSSLTNCPEFKYRWDDVWTLPIGVFMDSVERVQKHKSYNFVMHGIYSGCVDMKKLDKKELHWMGDLK